MILPAAVIDSAPKFIARDRDTRSIEPQDKTKRPANAYAMICEMPMPMSTPPMGNNALLLKSSAQSPHSAASARVRSSCSSSLEHSGSQAAH